ncbi:MAG: ftsA-1 [Dehalococcoidia bacterium]|nr:ftsA-1 [Dehalococcoidia bacterium]
MRSDIVAAIDVGTTKVCTLVGHEDDNGVVQILGVGVSSARGINKGMVVDVELAAESIRISVERAEKSSGNPIDFAYVGITGSHIGSLNNKGVVAINHNDRVVGLGDVERVIEAAKVINIPNNRQVLHVLPRSYTLDGLEGVKNPLGLHGFRLDLEAHIITGSVASVQNLTKCVEEAGVGVDGLILEPLASGEAVLTQGEKDTGVLLADIGGGTTDIAVFIDGSILHTSVIPLGGNHFTNDLVIGLRAPYAAAEEAKIRFGNVDPKSSAEAEEAVEVSGFGAETRRSVSPQLIRDILRPRLEEVLEMIMGEIRRTGLHSRLPAGLVLTGGTANLRGISSVASSLTKMPTRVGKPDGVYGLMETVSNPAFSTSVGLLIWALKYGDVREKRTPSGFFLADAFKRLASWTKELVPG